MLDPSALFVEGPVNAPADEPQGRVLPHLVVRVGGLPVRLLEELRAVRSQELAAGLAEVEKQLEARRHDLTESLFVAVGGLEDEDARRALLRLKRDVHNGRKLKAGPLAAVGEAADRGTVARDLQTGLQTFADLQGERRRLQEELEEVFPGELASARRRFQAQVKDEDFRKGLLLSSRTLASQVSRYVKASPKGTSAKVRQVERSLMRYFSRTVMKATPFGTFCTILPGRLASGGELSEPPRFTGDPRSKRSHLRLNKALYGQLLPLLVRRPEIRRHLHVELNPTLRQDGEKWLFLAAMSSGEVFQRLSANPVVDLFRRLLERRGHVPLEELLRELCDHPDLEASREEAEAFVDRLLELGFLRFRIGIREQEVNWDAPLAKLLAEMDDDHARTIRRLLEELREQVDRYPAATVAERAEILEGSQGLVKEAFEALGAKPPKNLPPFYEDAGGEAALDLRLGETADCLEELVRITNRLSWSRSEQANMRAFFDRFYGDGRGPVNLLRFYEDYYREHYKGHLERQRKKPGPAAAQPDEPAEEEGEEQGEDLDKPEEAPEAGSQGNPFGLPIIDQLREARDRLARRLRELWREDLEAEEIVLQREDLEAAVAGVPPSRDPCRSASMFGQLVHGFGPDGEPALVASSFLGGYGKYFSRFLYLLPPETYEGLLESNRALAVESGAHIAEICGDAAFNANLHPPLLPWELSYPTGESGAAEQQIPSSEVFVEPAAGDPHRLRLSRGPGGPDVVPVDLGFLNSRMRPPLFQLLSRSMPVASFGLQVPESPLDPPSAGEEGKGAKPPASAESAEGSRQPTRVRYRPRVTYRRRLILARRSWTLPGDEIPRRLGHETEASYFLRLDAWRRDLGLPQEVFVRCHMMPGRPVQPATVEKNQEGTQVKVKKEGAKGKPQPVRQHLYKPQYLDFGNPLLVDLFSRLGEGLDRFLLTVEERLPAREHLVRSGAAPAEERWATELVFQVDFGPTPPAPEQGAAGDPDD